ncbi:MAG: hypothetical protein ABFS14_06140 [Gemmatimonadota bacterium]
MTAVWRDLRGAEAGRVFRAAVQAHWAARIAGAFGKALARPEDDWGHVSLSWIEHAGAFWGAPSEPGGLRTGLSLTPLALHAGQPAGEAETLDLAGLSPQEAHAWLESVLRVRMGEEAAALLEPPEPDAAHPEATAPADSSGAPPDDEALAALEAWFSNASGLLLALASDNPNASPVRCWPHHFDIATLITLDPDADPETARSVGVGFSAGDGGHPEPYAYVLPWPRPGADAEPRPFSGAGEWVSDDWFGARVSRSALMAAGGSEAQQAATATFIREAVREAYRLIGGEQPGEMLHTRPAREETGS